MNPTTTFAAAAIQSVVRFPTAGSNPYPATSTPRTAPNVFSEYSAPTVRLVSSSRLTSAWLSTGKVPPISVVGTSSSAKSRMNWRIPKVA